MSLLRLLFLFAAVFLVGCARRPEAMTLAQASDYDAIQSWMRQRPPDGESAPQIALLADAGTWPAGAIAIVAALESAGTPVHVGDHRLLTAENLRPFHALILPGGWAPLQRQAAGPQGLDAIQAFVADGGTCVGVCAGAYLVSRTVRWEGATYEYAPALFDGIAEGPLNKYPVAESIQLRLTPAGALLGLPPDRSYYLNGGCAFIGGTNITALATFPNGAPAIISRPVGKGRVILLAVHPEHAPPPATSNLAPGDTAKIYGALLAP